MILTAVNENGDNDMVKYPSRRRKNLFLLVLSVVIAVILARQDFVREAILSSGDFGYLSAFVGGLLFSSSFTVPFSYVMFATLADKFPILVVGLIGGLGAMAGDLLLMRLFRDEIVRDLEPIYDQLGGGHLRKILHTKYFSWTLPIIAAVILASPLPDEIGISLLGMSHLSTGKFLVISFIMNSLGILIITLLGSLL